MPKVNPHITDFGLAKLFDQTDPDHPPTTANQILGTPHYMSPEQADPSLGPITPQTDVYGLGGILFALLTGKPPIQGNSITQVLTQIVSPDPLRSPRELRPEIPAGLETICRKCLSKRADDRYASAKDVARALRAWLERPGGAEPTEEAATNVEAKATTRDARWAPDRSLKQGVRAQRAPLWERPRGGSPVKRVAVAFALAGILLLVFLEPRFRSSSRPTAARPTVETQAPARPHSLASDDEHFPLPPSPPAAAASPIASTKKERLPGPWA